VILQCTEISRESYETFVNGHHGSSVFHGLAWLDAVTVAYRIDVKLLGLLDGEQLLGALPVFHRRMYGFNLYGSPLRQVGTPANLPLLAPESRKQDILDAIDQWVKRQGVGYFQLTWTLGSPPQLPSHIRQECFDNLEIDLSPSLQTLWNNLSSLPKRKIRNAVRHGIRLHWLHPEHILLEYTSLLQATYDVQGINPNYPLQMYRETATRLPAKSLRVLAATQHGVLLAAVWLLTDSQTVYYWDAASNQASRDTGSGHLLVWELIRWAKAHKLPKLDMVGTGAGRGGSRPGIGRFKKSFGAQPVRLHVLYWQGGWLRLAFYFYRRLMRFWYWMWHQRQLLMQRSQRHE
jgi:hypothetical protein